MRSAVVAILVASAAAVGSAVGDETPPRWETRATLSYVTSEDFRGAGLNAAFLHGWGSFAAGVSIDTVLARMSGVTRHVSGPIDVGGQPYSYSVLSWMLAGVAQLRIPAGPVMPYLEASLGLASAVELERENTQCGYGTGPGVGAAAGVAVLIDRRFSVGARAAARTVAGTLGCTAIGGPQTFDTVVVYAWGATFDVRW